MNVVTIIVNYRSAELTLEAIQSALVDIKRLPNAKIMIVDNQSGDDSVSIIEKAIVERNWEQYVSLIAAEKNGGFGYGNNVAIKAALEQNSDVDAFYLLNPDAMLKPDGLINLLQFMKSNEKVGFAGGGIYGLDGEQHRTQFRFPSCLTEFATGLQINGFFKLFPRSSIVVPCPTQHTQVDWLGGASLLIRRKVLDDVGFFDESFFLYFEEIDLIRRSAQRGWQTWYVANSAITHIESASTGVNDMTRPMPRYWFESRRYYFLKTHGVVYLQFTNVASVVGQLLGRIKNTLLGKKSLHRKNYIRDFIRYSF